MMLSILLSFGFATAASPQITIDELTIDTPTSLIQCETTTLTWTGGNSPYYVYIYPEFYLDESSFYHYPPPFSVNVPAGKKIRFNVRDSVNPGFEGSAFTDAIDISAGTDDACLATGPIGTGGIPPIPSNTGVPSGFGNFSAPSVAPFPGTGTIISTSAISPSGSISITSGPASSLSASGSSASATSTGFRNGNEPANGGTSNSGSTNGGPSMFVLGGMIGFVWVCISIQ